MSFRDCTLLPAKSDCENGSNFDVEHERTLVLSHAGSVFTREALRAPNCKSVLFTALPYMRR